MQFTELLFSFKSKSHHSIDWFWANHLRGFLGMKLKRTFCIQRGTPCSKCRLQATCPYFQTYEVEDKSWRISPPDKFQLQKGDTFCFKIILWSKVLNYALQIIKVMESFKTDRFELVSVKNFDQILYENGTLFAKSLKIREVKSPRPFQKRFVLHLRTPLRVKQSKKLVTQIDSTNIARLFGLRGCVENIQVTKIFEEWIDFQRFSHRQKTAMRLGGLIGKYEIFDPEGQLGQPLALGQILGLGKARTFGFGDIRVENIQVLKKGA